jgi:hypothetical protein
MVKAYIVFYDAYGVGFCFAPDEDTLCKWAKTGLKVKSIKGTFYAESWESAMQMWYDYNGWGVYKPMCLPHKEL